jgi:uncharacterized Zn finger protein (UPF0148 family)
MSKSTCESCGKPMFAQAVTCPHCGARQSSNDPLQKETPASRDALRELSGEEPEAKRPLSVSKEEAQALLTLDAISHSDPGIEDTRGGVASYMVLPQTTGKFRSIEIVFTVLAFPLIALVIFTVGSVAWKYRFASIRGVARMSVPTAALGAFGLAWTFGADALTAGIIVGAMFLCWMIREIIRTRSRPNL